MRRMNVFFQKLFGCQKVADCIMRNGQFPAAEIANAVQAVIQARTEDAQARRAAVQEAHALQRHGTWITFTWLCHRECHQNVSQTLADLLSR